MLIVPLMDVVRNVARRAAGYEWIGIGMGLIIVSVIGAAAVGYYFWEKGRKKAEEETKKEEKRKETGKRELKKRA